MKLYHGSTVVIEHPDVMFSRPNLDFGTGFDKAYEVSHESN